MPSATNAMPSALKKTEANSSNLAFIAVSLRQWNDVVRNTLRRAAGLVGVFRSFEYATRDGEADCFEALIVD